MSFSHRLTRSALAVTALAAAGLLAACGSGNERAQPRERQATTDVRSQRESRRESTCERAIADATEGAEELGDAQLAALATEAPRACGDPDALREALGAAGIGEEEVDGLVVFLFITCLAGDARAPELGMASTVDTAFCRDARSELTLTPDHRVVPAKATYEEDFEDGCGGWPTDRSPRVRFECRDGHYNVLVLNPLVPQEARLFDERSHGELSVEADVVVVSREHAQFEANGVSCWSSRAIGYLFVLSPDGSYWILREDNTRGRREFLDQGLARSAATGVEVRNRIRGDCTAGRRGTELTMYVNGERVGTGRDRRGRTPLTGFGVFVGTSEPNTEVRFDNVLVRETTP